MREACSRLYFSSRLVFVLRGHSQSWWLVALRPGSYVAPLTTSVFTPASAFFSLSDSQASIAIKIEVTMGPPPPPRRPRVPAGVPATVNSLLPLPN